MSLSRKDYGILSVCIGTPAILGFLLGVVTGGAYNDQSWTASQAMVAKHVDTAVKSNDTAALACAVLAWKQTKPVTEEWWGQCLSRFDDRT